MLTLSGPEYHVLNKIIDTFEEQGWDRSLRPDEKAAKEKLIARIRVVEGRRSMDTHKRFRRSPGFDGGAPPR